MALAAGGKKAEAVDQLLESFRRDRKWNEEAARKQLVQLFDAWGPKDPPRSKAGAGFRRSCSPDAAERVTLCRPLASAIADPADLPQRIPVFPLRRAILLPRAALPLNVFEPRYLAMLDDVMSAIARARHRAARGREARSRRRASRSTLRRVGCVGRVTAYQELEDGRLVITLTGIARCHARGARSPADKPYRICTVDFDRFWATSLPAAARTTSTARAFSTALKTYLEARSCSADWSAIAKSSTRSLVNSLADRQPLRARGEAGAARGPDLKARAEMLVALAEMELAAGPAAPAPRCNRGGSERTRCADEARQGQSQADRVDPRLLEILVCPRTKTSLIYDEARRS